MADELVTQYQPLLKEFNLDDAFERQEHAQLVDFLSRQTPETLRTKVDAYQHSMQNGSSLSDHMKDKDYRSAMYVAQFEKKGTILCPDPPEKIVEMVKAVRRALYDDKSH